MLTPKHLGRGTWGLVDPETGEVEQKGLTKEAAERLSRQGAAPASTTAAPPASPVRQPVNRDKEYQARMAADLARPLNEEMSEIRAVLAKRRDEDEVNILMQIFAPALKAGKQAVRRERRHVIPPRGHLPTEATTQQ